MVTSTPHQIPSFETRHQFTPIFPYGGPPSRSTSPWRRGISPCPHAAGKWGKAAPLFSLPPAPPLPPARRAPHRPRRPPVAGARGGAAGRGGVGRGERQQSRGEGAAGGVVSIFEPCLPLIYLYIAARCRAVLCSQRDRTDTALAEAWTLLILFSEALLEKPFLTM